MAPFKSGTIGSLPETWDYKLPNLHLWPKHWIGVHPKAGYYDIDVEAIATAYEHGLIFDQK